MNVNYILTARGFDLPDIQHALLNAETPKEAEQDVTKIIRILSVAGYVTFVMWEIREDMVWLGVAHYDIVPPSEIPVNVEYVKTEEVY